MQVHAHISTKCTLVCINDNGMKIQYSYDNKTGLIQNNASPVEYSVGHGNRAFEEVIKGQTISKATNAVIIFVFFERI